MVNLGVWKKKQKNTEACRAEKRTSLFRGPLQRNIKGQSWLTQFSATSVEARLKMKEEKKQKKQCLEASTSMHNGHVKTSTSACACCEEAAKLILHESLSLSRYRDIMFHFTTLQLKRSFHSQSGLRSQRCRRRNLSASPAAK